MTMRTVALIASGALLSASPGLADPLPSWNDTSSKTAIVEFVEGVTDPESADYVTPSARIATFDNDGTLWAEQPVYFQLIYALERLREKAEEDPSIVTSDALRSAVDGDMEALMAGGTEGLVEVLNVSHSGMTVEEFQADVRDWLGSAKHPQTDKLYGEMIYQPMLELLAYLRENDFQTWIVSGGGIHFVRAFAEETYGIPPENVVGSETPTTYDAERQAVVKEPGIAFLDDKAGKPVGIDNHIGRRPIFSAGNSDGDFEMIEYATSGDGPSFGLIVHHTDAEREFEYDRESHIGKLERGLDEGPGRDWVIVDVAQDWAVVWP